MLKAFTFILTCSTLLLSACISDPVQLSKSAEVDFQRAKQYVASSQYEKAILFLEKFTTKYPYSQYTAAAELMRLKASYFDEQYVLSETLGLRFLDTHPEHKDRVYAQYLVAMSYYQQSSSAMLDQQFTHKSRDAFLELNRQFPVNPYTKDIQKYVYLLTNRVAEHEMIVGKFYLKKKMYVAAVNRFIRIKNDYAEADIADESLYNLAVSYLALKQKHYAQETIHTLEQKFPQSPWNKKASQLI